MKRERLLELAGIITETDLNKPGLDWLIEQLEERVKWIQGDPKPEPTALNEAKTALALARSLKNKPKSVKENAEPTDREVLEDVYNRLHEIAGPDNEADYVEVEAALEHVLKVVKNQLLLKGTAP